MTMDLLIFAVGLIVVPITLFILQWRMQRNTCKGCCKRCGEHESIPERIKPQRKQEDTVISDEVKKANKQLEAINSYSGGV